MDEAEKVEELKRLVDRTCSQILCGCTDEAQARSLAADARRQARLLIPDDMDKFDLIYGSRFERLIEQFLRGESPAADQS